MRSEDVSPYPRSLLFFFVTRNSLRFLCTGTHTGGCHLQFHTQERGGGREGGTQVEAGARGFLRGERERPQRLIHIHNDNRTLLLPSLFFACLLASLSPAALTLPGRERRRRRRRRRRKIERERGRKKGRREGKRREAFPSSPSSQRRREGEEREGDGEGERKETYKNKPNFLLSRQKTTMDLVWWRKHMCGGNGVFLARVLAGNWHPFLAALLCFNVRRALGWARAWEEERWLLLRYYYYGEFPLPAHSPAVVGASLFIIIRS